MNERILEGLNGGRFRVFAGKLSTLINDFTAFDSGAGSEVDEVAGGADGVFVMFDEEEGVSFRFECLQCAEEGRVVAGVETDGRFVEDVEDALEI